MKFHARKGEKNEEGEEGREGGRRDITIYTRMLMFYRIKRGRGTRCHGRGRGLHLILPLLHEYDYYLPFGAVILPSFPLGMNIAFTLPPSLQNNTLWEGMGNHCLPSPKTHNRKTNGKEKRVPKFCISVMRAGGSDNNLSFPLLVF